MTEVKNAIIRSATLTKADHGVLSAWVELDYGGSCQGFGGHALYLPKSCTHHSLNGPAGHFIWRVLEIADVAEWGKLVGKTIRVRGDHCGVEAIGHIVKEDWFCPRDDFKGLATNDAVSAADGEGTTPTGNTQEPDAWWFKCDEYESVTLLKEHADVMSEPYGTTPVPLYRHRRPMLAADEAEALRGMAAHFDTRGNLTMQSWGSLLRVLLARLE